MIKKEKFHWADEIAEQVIKEFKNKKEYVCAAGISPSGTIHFGNFREVMTVELVTKALKDLKKKVKFIYSWDDFDRFRKSPANVPKSFDKYIGMPYSKIPDPSKCHKSYAEHFEKEFEESLIPFKIKPEFIRQTEKYENCIYANEIKFIMNKRDEIKKILDKYRKEPLPKNWYPLTIYCEKCKYDFTKVTAYDGKYSIEYECACGYKNKINFSKKGIVKPFWRIEWPMRQIFEGVNFEPGGKEHSTPGGSRTTAKELIENIWKKKAPIYRMYDFIILKGVGGKMAGSIGNIITLKQVLEIYEPEIIKYFFASTRPNKEFFISFDLDVIKNYEDFDSLEKDYFNKKINKKQKRIYELSCIEKIKGKPIEIPFRHLTTLLQIYQHDPNKIKKFYKIKNNFDKKRLETRAKCAKNWLEKYAPPEFKFNIQEKVSYTPNEKEKKALKLLKKALETKKFNENTLFKEFYNICQETEISPKEFFKAAYKVVINKERGPKLATLILAATPERITNILKQVK
jgi:lysyl-tRNA synthetase class 1